MAWLQTAILALAMGGTGDPVLLDFYADWCGPCRQMDPTVEQLIARGYHVRRVNVDQNKALAKQYGVRSIPCFVMVSAGREVDRVVGPTSYSRLAQMCDNAAPGRASPRAGDALGEPRGLAGAWRSKSGSSSGAWTPSAAAPDMAAPPSVDIPATWSAPVFSTSSQQAAASRASAVVATSHAVPDAATPRDVGPGWHLPAPETATPVAGASGVETQLIACTVRLRVEDPDGHSCGTGTIIDARQGQALILTCGHIFRDSQGKGQIEVDLFGPHAGQQAAGKLISYDLDRDVALLSIVTPGPVAAARVAPPGHRIANGDAVISLGCNNGAPPTARRSRVSSLNKFLGPPNVQVADVPVEGRSGGGLFSADGLVLGVCNAADPTDHEGLYAGLASIQAELDRNGLAYIYQASLAATGASSSSMTAVTPPSMPSRMPGAQDALALSQVRVPRPSEPQLTSRRATNQNERLQQFSADERAALSEIRRHKAEGAEVICIVRSRSDARAKSEILVLDQASPAFLEVLAGEAKVQDQRHLTSLEVPRERPAAPADASRSAAPGAWPSVGNESGGISWQTPAQGR